MKKGDPFFSDSLYRNQNMQQRVITKPDVRKARATQIGQCGNPILKLKVFFILSVINQLQIFCSSFLQSY